MFIPPKAMARIGQVPARLEISERLRQPEGNSRFRETSPAGRRTTTCSTPVSGARCSTQETSAVERSGCRFNNNN